MNLHSNEAAFRFIVNEVSRKSHIRPDILEKDYYVTLLLEELSKKRFQAHAYFKGGTALYKAIKSIRRFSEDIDLTVFVEDCPTQSQAKKRLNNACLKFKLLGKGQTIESHHGSVECEYFYNSLFSFSNADKLQRFGKVKIEATSFTVSEPTEILRIAPCLYDFASAEQQAILSKKYGVNSFEIKTITLERIFIDKLFAAEFYYSRRSYRDVAKHVYDLAVLLNNCRIGDFLNDKIHVLKILELERKEESYRKGGIPANVKIADFLYFTELANDKEFKKSFLEMQSIYVFNEQDKLCFDDVLQSLAILKKEFDTF